MEHTSAAAPTPRMIALLRKVAAYQAARPGATYDVSGHGESAAVVGGLAARGLLNVGAAGERWVETSHGRGEGRYVSRRRQTILLARLSERGREWLAAHPAEDAPRV